MESKDGSAGKPTSRDTDGKIQLAALKNHVISSLDIKSIYLSYITNATGKDVKVKSDGWSELVLCPIHQDQNTPNFSFSVHSGGYHCFACGSKGSLFDFWCRKNGLEPSVGFREALIYFANIANINIDEWNNSPSGFKATQVGIPIDANPKQVYSVKSFVPKVNKAEAANQTKAPLKKTLVKKYCEALQPEHYKYLNFERGLNAATIAKYQIGWNYELKYQDFEKVWRKGKFTIPVLDQESNVRNIRVYCRDTSPEYKMINTKGYGSPARLFPLNELVHSNWEHICFVEGEWDCMLLNQLFEEAGISNLWGAVTGTAGCNTFEVEWLEYFWDKKFYFIFDVDPPGRTSAHSHCTTFFLDAVSAGKIKELKIITLPLDGTKEFKDITDYFVKTNGTIADLILLIDSTPPIIVGGAKHDEATIEPEEISSFVNAIKDRQYIDRRIRVPLTISGQSTKIYHATRSLRVVKCPAMKDDNCCSSNAGILTIPYGDVIFIESCMATKRQLAVALQGVACSVGNTCTIEEVEKVVMEEYFGHQVIRRLTVKENEEGRMINSQELVPAAIYVLQPEKNIEIGPHDYVATGFVRSHPKTRQATLFVEHLEALEEDWKKFEVTPESIKHLKHFQKLSSVKEILKQLTLGVTQIYESDDILLTVLLTYLSPLWMNFNGQIMRGWINSCIIGDSGTGKSATFIRISDWLELGDLFSALSGTRTGLLYSLKQNGNEWYVQVGRYVMASGKIIAVDETQEMRAEEIKKMGKAMDEGWLDVSQVASGGYSTQTRCLLLMNPKSGKKISDFSYGCQSIAECFDPMFIRRLDIAIFSSGKDDYKFYNKEFDYEAAQQIDLTPQTFKALIYWAWTRTVNDVHWSQEATKHCLDKAVELAEIYGQSDDIPLVSPQDCRNNLARLSTAFAILSGSFTDDYSGVNIEIKHVDSMFKFIDIVYSAPSCNLKQHSKNSGKKKTLKDYEKIVETFNVVIEYANKSGDRRWSEGQHFLQMIIMLQQNPFVRMNNLQYQLAVGPKWVQKHISILQMHNLIEVFRSGYKTTRKFNLFLQRWQEEEGVVEMLDQVHEKIGKMALLQNPEDYSVNSGDNVEYAKYSSEEKVYGEPDPFQ